MALFKHYFNFVSSMIQANFNGNMKYFKNQDLFIVYLCTYLYIMSYNLSIIDSF